MDESIFLLLETTLKGFKLGYFNFETRTIWKEIINHSCPIFHSFQAAQLRPQFYQNSGRKFNYSQSISPSLWEKHFKEIRALECPVFFSVLWRQEHENLAFFFNCPIYFFLSMYDIQHCFIWRPSDSDVSEDAGIEPRTVVTTALTTRLDLIHYSARSHPHSARSHPQSARSHPQLG